MLDAGVTSWSSTIGAALISVKNYYGKDFEADLTGQHLALLGPSARARPRAPARTCASRCARSSTQ